MPDPGHDQVPPDPWVARFSRLIPGGGAVLDLAAGAGRHAIFLSELGYSVTAVDRDVSRLTASGSRRDRGHRGRSGSRRLAVAGPSIRRDRRRQLSAQAAVSPSARRPGAGRGVDLPDLPGGKREIRAAAEPGFPVAPAGADGGRPGAGDSRLRSRRGAPPGARRHPADMRYSPASLTAGPAAGRTV